jgi:hypothetical protein
VTAAEDFAAKTTIPWDEWVRRVQSGGYTDAQLHRTYWFRAGAALEAQVRPPKPPAPVPSSLGQRCVYMSSVTEEAIDAFLRMCAGTPHGWYTIIFSADLNESKPGKAYYVTDGQIAWCKKVALVGSWCDSSETPTAHAVLMAHTRGLDFASGQCENGAQFDDAIRMDVPLLIGNPSELADEGKLDDAIREQKAGRAFIGEVLSPDPTYSAQGLDIASACYYIDRDANRGGYCPLSAYAGHPAGQRRSCSVYTGGRMLPADWELYKAWTKP